MDAEGRRIWNSGEAYGFRMENDGDVGWKPVRNVSRYRWEDDRRSTNYCKYINMCTGLMIFNTLLWQNLGLMTLIVHNWLVS